MPDPHNYKQLISDFSNQLASALELGGNVKLPKGIEKVIVCGMGGSGIAGDVLVSVMQEEKLPVFVAKDYKLPAWADAKTLVFCVSYSGDTQETLSAFSDAQKKKCFIVSVTSGGKLREFSSEYKIPYVSVPRDFPPRAALGYLFVPMIVILENAGLVKGKIKEVQDAISVISQPGLQGKAEQLAGKLRDKTPLIYASPRLVTAAVRWKDEFNENAKVHAFWNVFSELCHNEIVGYTLKRGEWYVFLLRDEKDNRQIAAQMDRTRDIIKTKGVEVMEINLKGTSTLVKLFTAIHLGDWLSYYHALGNNVDPYPVDVIVQLKKK